LQKTAIRAILYYAKAFCSVFGNTEFALRLFSALGAVALAALGAGPVKRVFGKTTG
jgi:4-amino-4-deoxy-L-arabinose transferase-like glycosyltransferase